MYWNIFNIFHQFYSSVIIESHPINWNTNVNL